MRRTPELPAGYPNDPCTLGEKIRMHRLDLGLSQPALAARLGVRESTLRGWERGRHHPRLRLLPRIDAFLGREPEVPLGSLGARVRAARRRLGLSRFALAQQIGVDKVTIWSVETGRRPPSARTLDRLRALLTGPETPR